MSSKIKFGNLPAHPLRSARWIHELWAMAALSVINNSYLIAWIMALETLKISIVHSCNIKLACCTKIPFKKKKLISKPTYNYMSVGWNSTRMSDLLGRAHLLKRKHGDNVKANMLWNKFTLEKGIMYMNMERSNHRGVQIERCVNGHIFSSHGCTDSRRHNTMLDKLTTTPEGGGQMDLCAICNFIIWVGARAHVL